ncbi:transcription factor [Apophysomyces sp. BC1034]|nr:transcription factor [Apophysomyces sp. BC1015]KAG0180231.1 transcription factor [Apophysomyces sp. BC1021]KAG0190778.1 transcription factor [Apophysomyces sp. BC1034]
MVSDTPSEFCFQISLQEDQTTKSLFPIVHEPPRQTQLKRQNELKFKIESVGTQPEQDDDLDSCPARTRAAWPRQINPWWKPTHPHDKPPYSYATLIAHAILSNKDGRLTLSEIYRWISKHYPFYTLGRRGWQNSIRHNLSLNKKWFLKLDRRPTQANPGKGCYWTLIPGTEQVFIDNLTQAGGHSRKHHDIGLTAELSMSRQYYNHEKSTTQLQSATSTFAHTNMLITRPEDYQCRNKKKSTTTLRRRAVQEEGSAAQRPPVPPPRMSPMYTTFRTNPAEESGDEDNEYNADGSKADSTKRRRRPRRRRSHRRAEPGSYCESEYDSGVDVGNEYLASRKKKSKTDTTADGVVSSSVMVEPAAETAPAEGADINWQHFLDVDLTQLQNDQLMLPMALDIPPPDMLSTTIDPLWGCSANYLLDQDWLQPQDGSATMATSTGTQPQTSYPTLLASRYDPPQQQQQCDLPENTQEVKNDNKKVEECLEELLQYQQQQQQQSRAQALDDKTVEAQGPITIDLRDDFITKYLHFENDYDDLDSDAWQFDLDQFLEPSQAVVDEFVSMRELLYS